MTENFPLISIITVCYNEEKNIRNTCESIKSQTYKNIEWIVIDGGSKDNTVAILNEYQAQISYMISEKDKGIYNAMNKGVAQAKGDYLLFLNGGDYLKSATILEEIFTTGQTADVLYGDISLEDGKLYKSLADVNQITYNFFLKPQSLNHQATFIKRGLFDLYGLYDESFKYAADYEWFLRVFNLGKNVTWHRLDKVVSVFDMDGMSENRNLWPAIHSEIVKAQKQVKLPFWEKLHFQMLFVFNRCLCYAYLVYVKYFKKRKKRMRNLLITGANGFVGKHAIAYALENHPDTKIWALVRQIDEKLQSAYPQVQWQILDMLDADSLEKLIVKIEPDAVLHLAAASSVGYSWEHPRESTLNNLNTYLNLLESVRKNCSKTRILSVGSSEVYGKVDEAQLPLKEDYNVSPASPYGVARASQEALSHVYVDGYEMDIVMTRSFNHFGPGQDSRFALPSFARQIAEARNAGNKTCHMRVGNIDVIRDFTDVRDVVASYFLLLEKGVAGQIYNICSGIGHSLRDVIQSMASYSGIEVAIEIDEKLVRPQDLPRIIGSNEKIEKEIGWKLKIPFQMTVENIIDEWTIHGKK